MTQHKAASLTSNLFARKGRASPASLLIAEMEGVAPDVAADAGDVAPGPNGKRKGARKLDLNGSAASKKDKAPAVEELPLLAFVEAQSAEDERAGEEVAGDEGAAEPSPESPKEPSPPASLLDSGARALRQANGRAPAVGVVPLAAVAAEDGAPAAPAEADAGEIYETETVSGDANVAAIEDAPQDEPEGAEPQDAAEDFGSDTAEAETVAPDAAEPEAAAEDGGNGDIAAEPQENDPPETREGHSERHADPLDGTLSRREVAQKISAGEAVSATVALRQAAASRATPMPSPRTAAPTATAAPPKPAGGVLPWRSAAAVVALGVVLGLGAYIALSGNPAAPPAESKTPVAETAPLPETQPSAAGAEAAPAEMTPGTAAPAAQLPEPSFDVIRIEPDGQSIIAGRATPGSEWILLNNGSPIASVQADVNGEWVVLPDASLVPGANAFSLVPKTERGKVAIPAPAEQESPSQQPAPAAPAELRPQSSSGVEAAPSAEAESRLGVVLPQPKPAVPHAGPALRVRLSEEGDYQLQVASVRQSADAQRERDRLSAAYPDLLGDLGLRVQEASVEGAGIFFRVRSGGISDLGAAREVCRRLEAAGQGCLVVRRAPAAETPRTDTVQEEAAAQPLPPEQQAQRPQ